MSGSKKFSEGYLKNQGVDPHEVKEEYECKPVAHYDIYNGDTVTIRDKQGNLWVDTELSKEKFFRMYGYDKEQD